jgi:hypothetical protein
LLCPAYIYCGISELPDTSRKVRQTENDVSMNEFPDVTPDDTGTLKHEEKGNDESLRSRPTERRKARRSEEHNNQDNGEVNSPSNQANQSDLWAGDDQIYGGEDLYIGRRAKEAATVENAYTVVQKKKRGRVNKIN